VHRQTAGEVIESCLELPAPGVDDCSPEKPLCLHQRFAELAGYRSHFVNQPIKIGAGLTGAHTLAVVTDVSEKDSMFTLADRAFATFGAVHILCNNAGISGGLGPVWEIPQQDWDWIMAVNFSGVLHGIQAFVPRMIEHNEEGVIINTTSVVGLTTGTTSAYGITKHAITRLTEGLHYDLQAAGSKLRAALLVPGATSTNILYADRNRPERFTVPRDEQALTASAERRRSRHARMQEVAMKPEEVGAMVVQAIKDERFYILADPERTKRFVRLRMEAFSTRRGQARKQGCEDSWRLNFSRWEDGTVRRATFRWTRTETESVASLQWLSRNGSRAGSSVLKKNVVF
jgi:NAD(P)-dependent dehydrogenase (short-subunit alcohol dehydrogenase family)